mmetsp:Transcript_21478/g.59719  ORF Transcript_21478/g.59719 Transcript_21478/m.59719 type:complete len:137 (-) Transcript_21478:881-1291(-)
MVGNRFDARLNWEEGLKGMIRSIRYVKRLHGEIRWIGETETTPSGIPSCIPTEINQQTTCLPGTMLGSLRYQRPAKLLDRERCSSPTNSVPRADHEPNGGRAQQELGESLITTQHITLQQPPNAPRIIRTLFAVLI